MAKIMIFIGLWLAIALYAGCKIGQFIYRSDYRIFKALSHSPKRRSVALPMRRAAHKTQ